MLHFVLLLWRFVGTTDYKSKRHQSSPWRQSWHSHPQGCRHHQCPHRLRRHHRRFRHHRCRHNHCHRYLNRLDHVMES